MEKWKCFLFRRRMAWYTILSVAPYIKKTWWNSYQIIQFTTTASPLDAGLSGRSSFKEWKIWFSIPYYSFVKGTRYFKTVYTHASHKKCLKK